MNFDDLSRLSCKKSQIIIQEPDFNRVNSVSIFYRKTLYLFYLSNDFKAK